MAEAQPTTIPCPNPLCTAKVGADDKVCSTCKHEITPCPQCNRLMSRNVGRCAFCGYGITPTAEETPEKPPSPPDTPRPGRSFAVTPQAPAQAPVFIFETSRSEITPLLADAYRTAALRETDMMLVTRVLEQLRVAFSSERDALVIWDLLDMQVGVATPTMRPVLMALRAWFEGLLFKQQRNSFSALFEKDGKS